MFMLLKQNKAQAGALVFMLAVVVVILALAFVKPVNQITTSAMSENATEIYGDYSETGRGLNCSGTITDFTKAGCWTADIGQAYFIWAVLAFAGVIIGAKVLFD